MVGFAFPIRGPIGSRWGGGSGFRISGARQRTGWPSGGFGNAAPAAVVLRNYDGSTGYDLERDA